MSLYIPSLANDDFGPFVQGLADNFSQLNTILGTVERIPPTWQNGWTSRGSARICRDGFGNVWLEGGMGDGVVGETAFVLPVGFRPSTQREFVVSGFGNKMARLTVGTSGGVVLSGFYNDDNSANNVVYFSNVTFTTK